MDHAQRVYIAVYVSCPVIPYWRSIKILIGATPITFLSGNKLLFDKTLALPHHHTEDDLIGCLEKNNIPSLLKQGKGSILFVLQGGNKDETVKILASLGYADILVFPPPFKSSEKELHTLFEKDQFKSALGYSLPEEPPTNPLCRGRLIPFLNHPGDLVIPQDTDPIWHWWKGGIDPEYTVCYFQQMLDQKQFRELLVNYRSRI